MEMFTVVFFVYVGGLLLGVFIGRISKKMNKRVIKPKCVICKKELKEAIVIPSRINNRSFEMLAKLSLPICEECKKREEDELDDKTEKWNPAQELLISYIKECELTVFEVEKVYDFIRNEIKAKRDKGENT